MDFIFYNPRKPWRVLLILGDHIVDAEDKKIFDGDWGLLLAAQPIDDTLHLSAREFLVLAEGGHAIILFAVEPIVRGVIQYA